MPCVERTVLKPGPNKGKRFYVCSKPDGRAGDARARCDAFVWLKEHAAASRGRKRKRGQSSGSSGLTEG